MIVGIIGFILASIVIIPGIGYLAGIGPEDYTEEEMEDAGWGLLLFCAPIVFFPSLIIFYFGWQGYRRDERLRHMAEVLKGFKRISITELSIRTDRNNDETEKDIIECLQEGMIRGHIDPKTNEFVRYQPGPKGHPGVCTDYTKQAWTCPGCGTTNRSTIRPAERVKCHYCSGRFSFEPKMMRIKTKK
jgi:DNA-directed RNA polymerase subunit RPC12/RpoP